MTNINQTRMKNCVVNCKVINMCRPGSTPMEILLTGIPSNCGVGYIEAYIESTTEMTHGTDFILTQHCDGSLLIGLKKVYSIQGKNFFTISIIMLQYFNMSTATARHVCTLQGHGTEKRFFFLHSAFHDSSSI